MTVPDDIYTHGHHESVLRAHRWRNAENSAGYLLPHLRPGQRLLDVGCGPGTITLDLARRVLPGEVVGVDREEEALAAARTAACEQGITSVRFETGDAYRLDHADASFDVVHAHQVLQHLSDPVAALVEMRRVCRPGGYLAVRDADYQAMAWCPPEPGLERWLALYREVARSNGAEPDAGRRLRAWARAAGCRDLTSSTSAWCYASTEERRWWGSLWADRITRSALADQALARGFADRADLAAPAATWTAWAEDEDGWFAVLHGEILERVT